MNSWQKKLTHSMMVAAAMSAIFTAAVTVAADLYLPLKDWLKAVFYHHWLGKSALAALIFVFISSIGLFRPLEHAESRLIKSARLLFWSGAGAAATIVLFFLYETFWK